MSQKIIIDRIRKLGIYFLRLYGLYILFFICVIVLQSIFPYLDINKYSQDTMLEMLKNNKLNAFLTIVIIAPVFEELMFRTLVYPTITELLLFLSTWTLFILGFFIQLDIDWYYKHLITIVSTIVCFFIYKNSISIKILEWSKKKLHKHSIIILQLTSVTFGFIHIFNYVDSFRMDSILFLLIIPRIIAGHMFGKLKTENNHMIWPMLLHGMNNGVAFIIIMGRI